MSRIFPLPNIVGQSDITRYNLNKKPVLDYKVKNYYNNTDLSPKEKCDKKTFIIKNGKDDYERNIRYSVRKNNPNTFYLDTNDNVTIERNPDLPYFSYPTKLFSTGDDKRNHKLDNDDNLPIPFSLLDDSGMLDTNKYNMPLIKNQEYRYNILNENRNRILNDYCSKENNMKKITNLTIGEILINMKNTIYNLIYKLFNNQLDKDDLKKDNTAFYIGLFLIVICFLFILLKYINNK